MTAPSNTEDSSLDRRSLKLLFVTFLTFIRFPLVMIFFLGALINVKYDHSWIFVVALTSLIISALTDIVDGYFARKFKVETKFGAHADPLMDKFFYLATLPLLVFITTTSGRIPHAVFLLILTLFFLARDQWVTFLRSIGSIYGVSGSANWSGKLRTSVNFPLICSIYYFEEAETPFFGPFLLYSFEALAFVINLISLYIYTHRYWPCLCEAIDLKESAKQSAWSCKNVTHAQKIESLTTLAAGVAHDFNNILTAILGNTSIVLKRIPPDFPDKASIEQIRGNALQGVKLANQLMAYSVKNDIITEEINLAEIITEMMNDLRLLVPESVNIVYQIAEDIPVIEAAPPKIRQIILNLVINASDALIDKNGTITVSIGVTQCDAEYLGKTLLEVDPPQSQFVFLKVSDDGCGITPTVEKKMFDPCFTTKLRGRGMGLAVVIGVVRACGGTIKVETESKKGSVFTILLPHK